MQKMIMVSKFLSGLRKSRGGLNMSCFFPLQLGGFFFFCSKNGFSETNSSEIKAQIVFK